MGTENARRCIERFKTLLKSIGKIVPSDLSPFHLEAASLVATLAASLSVDGAI